MPEPVVRKLISWAEIHELFVDISDEFGFTTEEYEDELADLITLWTQQGFVEIYQEPSDKIYGRAKDSSLAQGASPYYIGLFHVRVVNGQNDPLVILVFDEIEGETVASLRFMVDHDDLFGSVKGNEKFNPEFMRQLRQRIDNFVKKGNRI